MTTQLEAMEARLEKSLLDKLRQFSNERMDTHEHESRIVQIESQLHQLVVRHQSLEGTVQEHHQQNMVQVQMLQSQMMSQLEVRRTQMRSLFDDQMEKLKTILAKGRYE